MATYSRKLKDASGNYVCPATRSSVIYLSDGSTLDDFIKKLYPVGSVYMSTDSTSPASLYGGAWEAINNKFLLGSGDSYTVKSSGGERSHKLTIPEMPGHYHQTNPFYRVAGIYGQNEGSPLWTRAQAYSNGGSYISLDWTNIEGTDSTGGSQSHNNMPPYYTVNIWMRVS